MSTNKLLLAFKSCYQNIKNYKISNFYKIYQTLFLLKNYEISILLSFNLNLQTVPK